jgi:hypothetical protein
MRKIVVVALGLLLVTPAWAQVTVITINGL